MSCFDPYFTRRLLDTLVLADSAVDCEERNVHLRACRYYRDLLCVPNTRKAERLMVNLPVTLAKEELPSAESMVADISTYGFKVRACPWLSVDADFILHLEGLAALSAAVVWLADEWAGCSFWTPLHPALLEAAIAVSKPGLRPLTW